MIRLPKAIEYFKHQITKSEGVIKNIFLANGQNEIIVTVGGNSVAQQASVLSTLLNDSIFIIRLNLLNGEQPRKNERPFQINLSIGERQAFLFSIKNVFILGVIVDQKTKAIGHKMANDIRRYVLEQMENVVEWVQNNDVY